MLEQNQHFSRRIVVHSVRKDVVDVDGGHRHARVEGAAAKYLSFFARN